MNIVKPSSELRDEQGCYVHDAPEHLRITLGGGKSFQKASAALGGEKNKDDRTEEVVRLFRAGLSLNAICTKLHMGDRKVAQIRDQIDAKY